MEYKIYSSTCLWPTHDDIRTGHLPLHMRSLSALSRSTGGVHRIRKGNMCPAYVLQAVTCCTLVSCSTLKMEMILSSETTVNTRSTPRYIPENGNIKTFVAPRTTILLGVTEDLWWTLDSSPKCFQMRAFKNKSLTYNRINLKEDIK
jgi:hypothetical protein